MKFANSYILNSDSPFANKCLLPLTKVHLLSKFLLSVGSTCLHLVVDLIYYSLLVAFGEVLEESGARACILSVRVILAEVFLEATVHAVVLTCAIGLAVSHPIIIKNC